MTDRRPPTSRRRATVSAWLDGELDAGRARAEVDAWLHDHPEDAARVRLWAADRDALRARFDPVLDEPMPPRCCSALVLAGAGRWRRAPPALAPGGAGGRAAAGRRRWSAAWSAPAGRRVTAALAAPALGRGERARRRLDAPRRGGARGLRARGAPPGGGERGAGQRGRAAGPGRAPGALADQAPGHAGAAVRPARAGLRAGGRPAAARRRRPERAADVPERAAASASPSTCASPSAAPGRVPLRAHGELGMFYWVEDGFGCALVGELPRSSCWRWPRRSTSRPRRSRPRRRPARRRPGAAGRRANPLSGS